MIICKRCAKSSPDGVKRCVHCGSPLSAPVQSAPAIKPEEFPAVNPVPVREAPAPSIEHSARSTAPRSVSAASRGESAHSAPVSSVMSTRAYVGNFLLMCIPLVGFIVAIVWACSRSIPLAKRNFARAFIILFFIGLVVFFIAFLALSIWLSTLLDAILPMPLSELLSMITQLDAQQMAELLGAISP